jgi:hypothetical protein
LGLGFRVEKTSNPGNQRGNQEKADVEDDSIDMEDASIDMGDASIDMEDASIDMGYLFTLAHVNPHPR